MVLGKFDENKVVGLIEMLSHVKKPSDLDMIRFSSSSELFGLDIIMSLPVFEPEYGPFQFPGFLKHQYIVPFFCYPYLYPCRISPFVRNILSFDYTVTFDTNFSSYVRNLVNKDSFEGIPEKAKLAIDHILSSNINFDLFFYFFENIKLAYPIARRIKKGSTPTEFWNTLNSDFKSNIVCLELFRSINNSRYIKEKKLEYGLTYSEAEQIAIKFTYEFYASPEQNLLVSEYYYPLQRLILFHLLAILRIQLSSNRSGKHKFREYLKFIQSSGQVYLPRECYIACQYFFNRTRVPILKRITKGCKTDHLLKKIDSIAWDFTSSRFIESLLAVKTRGDYYIPFFFSYDSDLISLYKMYPIKAIVFDRESGNTQSLPAINLNQYYKDHNCGHYLNEFMAEENRELRLSKIKNSDN